AVGVAEIDLDAGGDLDVGMARHLFAAVPGEGLEKCGRHCLDGLLHRRLQRCRFMAVGEMEQHHVAGLAFDESSDSGAVERPADEITLPVPWDCTVFDLGRALRD